MDLEVEEDVALTSCIGLKIPDDMLLANLTRVSDLLAGRSGADPLLAMRAALQRFAVSLDLLAASAAVCQPERKSWEGLKLAVDQLSDLVRAGRINDGICPFKQTRQTTIGGAEVGSQLRKLAEVDWRTISANDDPKVRKAAKRIGRLLRKVKADGNDPDPPGSMPVNWAMREALFGRSSVDWCMHST